MFQDASRIDDIKKRARHAGDDLVRRALSASEDLIHRALETRDGLAERALGGGDAVAQRARIQRDALLSRGRDMAYALGDRLPEPVRRRLPHKPTPIEETRSFLSSPALVIGGVLAAGVVIGLALNAGRKAALQGGEALHGDWLEVLKAEHKKVDLLFDQLLRTTDRQTLRRAFLLNRIAHALTKHAQQEELVVYPALKEATADGQAMHLYEDHAQIKIFIHELNEIPKNSPLWLERARAFRACIQHHVREEEDEIYPPYHDRMSPQQNRHITVGLHREGMKLA